MADILKVNLVNPDGFSMFEAGAQGLVLHSVLQFFFS